jgi:hypothetical protein
VEVSGKRLVARLRADSAEPSHGQARQGASRALWLALRALCGLTSVTAKIHLTKILTEVHAAP